MLEVLSQGSRGGDQQEVVWGVTSLTVYTEAQGAASE